MVKAANLIGNKYGRIIVRGFVRKDLSGKSYWDCECECGKHTVVEGYSLKSGNTKSCGCLHREVISSDLQGKRFGKLLVIKSLGTNARGDVEWECICDCGKITISGTNPLKSGHKKSCGCLHIETARNLGKRCGTETTGYKHGHGSGKGKASRTYNTWVSMIQRCTNPNTPNYPQYGGRGIIVCDRWRGSFKNFLSDMGERPENKSIDRIDVNGNYQPLNCRWATPKEQQQNRRMNLGGSYIESSVEFKFEELQF